MAAQILSEVTHMVDQNPTDQKLDAELREADARLSMLQSQANARHAKDEMDEITGLSAARDRASQKLADLKRQGTQSLDNARREVSGALHDLQVRIEMASDRYSAWDSARERRFNARVAEAEAQVKVWDAQTDAHQADGEIQYRNERAMLKQQIDTAKDKFKEWKARTNQETQDALATASRQLDATFDKIAQKVES
jgi:hypothetical protein